MGLRRRAFNWAVNLSLAVALVSVAGWVGSYARPVKGPQAYSLGTVWEVRSIRGTLEVGRATHRAWPAEMSGLQQVFVPGQTGWEDARWESWKMWLVPRRAGPPAGLDDETRVYGYGWRVHCSYWVIYLASAALPIVWLIGWIRGRSARRRMAGLCESCGYDMRATPERCPECGTVVTRAKQLGEEKIIFGRSNPG